MTTVHIWLGRDDGATKTAAKGVIECEPTTRREDGTMVVLERGFVKPLVDGEATVVVDPSGLTWCWREPVPGSGTNEPFDKDAKVTHKDQRWTSNLDNNVWEPGVYGWTLAPQ